MSGTAEVEAYIKSYKDVLPLTSEDDSGWLVVWDSPFASYSYTVSVSRSGSILGIAKKRKAIILKKTQLVINNELETIKSLYAYGIRRYSWSFF